MFDVGDSMIVRIILIGTISLLFACSQEKQVESIYDLGKCTEAREGDSRLVTDEKAYYICSSAKWMKVVENVKIQSKKEKTTDLVDSRDNQTYKTVLIGDKVWMAENLRYEPHGYDYQVSWCHENDCSVYGRYYTWAAAIDSLGVFSRMTKNCGDQVLCNINAKVRGICPTGWHIPDVKEWSELFTFAASDPRSLQSKGFPEWKNAINQFGFSAIPSGLRLLESVVPGSRAFFWVAKDSNLGSAYRWYLDEDKAGFDRNYAIKKNGHSIRCVKD